MKCQKCGCLIPEGSKFCQYCGIKLENQSSLDFIPDEATIAEEVVTTAELKSAETELSITPDTISITSLQPETAQEVPTSRMTKSSFCRKCGSPIDPITKKCTGCRKQYFNAKKAVPNVILSMLLVASISLNVVQYSREQAQTEQIQAQTEQIQAQTEQIEELKKEVRNQAFHITSLKGMTSCLRLEIEDLTERLKEAVLGLSFYEENAAIVPDDGSNLYHKYFCEDFTASYFWIYNTEAAIHYGYSPCPKCN